MTNSAPSGWQVNGGYFWIHELVLHTNLKGRDGRYVPLTANQFPSRVEVGVNMVFLKNCYKHIFPKGQMVFLDTGFLSTVLRIVS